MTATGATIAIAVLARNEALAGTKVRMASPKMLADCPVGRAAKDRMA
jgi:hypothetical protein